MNTKSYAILLVGMGLALGVHAYTDIPSAGVVLPIDTTTNPRTVTSKADLLSIAFSGSNWGASSGNATVTVTCDGGDPVTLVDATSSTGLLTWTPDKNGTYVLAHASTADGATELTATIVADGDFGGGAEIVPGESAQYASEAEAISATNTAVAKVPAGLTTEQGKAYAAMFKPSEPVLNPLTEKWEFTMVLTEAATAEVRTEISEKVLEIDLGAVSTNSTSEISVATKPGLWYNLEQGAQMDAMTGESFMATEALTIIQAKPQGSSGFYRLKAGASEADVE